jgi:NAD(P)-dependent dehydrogenase (short-subunit alcohol dehydrogenase family)
MAEAVRWGKRGARVNTIRPGFILPRLARDELIGPRGEGYRRMIELCPAGPCWPSRGAQIAHCRAADFGAIGRCL